MTTIPRWWRSSRLPQPDVQALRDDLTAALRANAALREENANLRRLRTIPTAVPTDPGVSPEPWGTDTEPPLGSVVRDPYDDEWQRYPDGWWCLSVYPADAPHPPATAGYDRWNWTKLTRRYDSLVLVRWGQ